MTAQVTVTEMANGNLRLSIDHYFIRPDNWDAMGPVAQRDFINKMILQAATREGDLYFDGIVR